MNSIFSIVMLIMLSISQSGGAVEEGSYINRLRVETTPEFVYSCEWGSIDGVSILTNVTTYEDVSCASSLLSISEGGKESSECIVNTIIEEGSIYVETASVVSLYKDILKINSTFTDDMIAEFTDDLENELEDVDCIKIWDTQYGYNILDLLDKSRVSLENNENEYTVYLDEEVYFEFHRSVSNSSIAVNKSKGNNSVELCDFLDTVMKCKYGVNSLSSFKFDYNSTSDFVTIDGVLENGTCLENVPCIVNEDEIALDCSILDILGIDYRLTDSNCYIRKNSEVLIFDNYLKLSDFEKLGFEFDYSESVLGDKVAVCNIC